MNRLMVPALLMLVTYTTSTQAMTIRQAEVSHRDGRYHIYFDVLIDANHETVSKYMDDYTAWTRWSSVVEKTTLLERIDNRSNLLQLQLNSCLFIFCRTLNKTERVTRIEPGHLVTLTTRDNRDFRYAREIWKATAKGHQTRLVYDAVMEPGFTVPLFRTWIISSRIRKELKRSIAQLEKIARTAKP